MVPEFNIHVVFEALGIATFVCLFLYPVYATIWEMSKERTKRMLAAQAEARETTKP